jgi:3-oxoacyl-[acyl-carrier protein] reductase
MSVPQRLLDGDRALVTGAAGGIGRGVAAALAAEGAFVLLADSNPTVESSAAAIRAAGGDASAIASDLSSLEGARALAQEAIAKLGRVTLFVHSASPRREETQTALEVSAAQWREMLAVNLDAGFVLGQTLGRHMREHAIRGRMLYVTSLHAESPRNLPHYSAAKAGQTMLVKELARALGPHGIRVNAIVPGAIPGGGFQAGGGLVERIALRRFGTPEDVAAMALAVLAERFGAYVTGASIVVDGGLALYNWIDAPQ